MLQKIKSVFTIRLIFEHIDEGTKYELLIYNKKLQFQLDLKIRNFNIFRDYYIIREKDGKCKQYDYETDFLIFEGDYVKGARNGHGKEYYKKNKNIDSIDYILDKNRLKFEGEYIKDERNGKGKEYDICGNLVYEGEYLNDKRWNGIEYIYVINESGWDELVYKLEYLKGKKWNGKCCDINNPKYNFELKDGKGYFKEYDYSCLIFEGEYLNGEKNGKGVEYFPYSSSKFEGEYINGIKWNGKGYDFTGNIIYEIKDGKEIKIKESNSFVVRNNMIEKKYGKNKEFYSYSEKIKFEGEYLYYKKKGKEYFQNGNLKFEGDYLFDRKWNGQGYDKNGKIIYKIKNGHGRIIEYDNNGDDNQIIYIGEYFYGKRNGRGKEYDNGYLKFEGEYLNGNRYKGKEFEGVNLVFEGEYLNGKRWNGKGQEYIDEEYEIFDGEYLNGKRWNGTGIEFRERPCCSNCAPFFERYKYEYINGKIWNAIKYEKETNITSITLKDGNGFVHSIDSNDVLFECQYVNGEKNGKGKEYHWGDLLFEGEYLNGKRWKGKGKEFRIKSQPLNIISKDNQYFYYSYNSNNYRLSNLIFEGEYLNGKKWNGKAKEYDDNGILIFRGNYVNGRKVQKI